MIGIIFATDREAAPFLKRASQNTTALDLPGGRRAVGARHAENYQEFPLFYDLCPAHALVVCICGMGPDRARAGTEALLEKYGVTSVVNVGAAGAVVDCATVGEAFRVATVCLWPAAETMYICRDDRWQNLPHVVLATVAEPVFDSTRKAEIARHADIVDMEGAAIAQQCRAKGIPLYMIKGVTDQAGENDRERLLRNLDTVAEMLADRVWEALEQV